MTRVTTASVNKALKARGADERLFHDKINKYFFFYGGNTEYWKAQAVMVYSAAQLTIDQWMQEYDTLRRDRFDEAVA